jgi:glutathione S-transferase
MRTLYHLWLSPVSRKVRLVLGEKGLDADLVVEKTWERREAYLALNPAGTVPLLLDENGASVADSAAICEYLDEVYPDPPVIGRDPATRAEVRRLVAWFDQKFQNEVSTNLLDQKVWRRFMGLGHPDSEAIRAGHYNLHTHLDYIGWLTERRNWLGGEEYSLADMAAAAHISCLDYLGDVPWEDHKGAKDWYARIKSRPAFRPLLADHIPGLPPPKHYADLDF